MSYSNNRNRRPSGRRQEPSRTRSVLGLFFNPALGSSLSTLRETGRMFVHMIALIFAQANLIDKRHPAVTGATGERFNLIDVILLAHQRVEWRQENIGQISMFIAVITAILVCGIGLVYALLTALMSVA